MACLLACGLVLAVAAQPVEIRSLDRAPQGEVLEVVAHWSQPLAAALDSAGVQTLSWQAVVAATGGAWETSETVWLPILAAPRVDLIAADYEEVPLRLDEQGASLAAWLNQPPVEVVGVGMERRRPAGTLSARLLVYDEARQVLRRYRRLQVRLRYPVAQASVLGTGLQPADNPHLQVTQSVLAEGLIVKFPVREEGLYRIDRATLAELLALVGRSVDEIDPRRLQLYGNGGRPLPALNSAPRPVDLIENPVWRVGLDDGSFDEGDALIFYAAGVQGWRYNAQHGEWEHYTHPFSNANYYFLKIGAQAGRQIATLPFPDAPDARPVTQLTGRYVVDPEDFLWSKEGIAEGKGSGLTWVSVPISPAGRLRILEGVLPPGLTAGTVTYRARVAIQSNPAAYVRFISRGQELARVSAGVTFPDPESPVARAAEVTFTQALATAAPLELEMTLTNPGGDPRAALEWLRVFYPMRLVATEDYLRFFTPPGQTGTFAFLLEGFSEPPQVWDVTDPGTIVRLEVRPAPGGYRVQVVCNDPERPRELVAFTPAAVRPLDPAGARRVPNQNLHGIDFYPDLAIITADTFRVYAEQLAEHRRRQGLRVVVATVEQIYNEFSGGVPDMRAVRDYLKFLYDRAPDESSLLRYALLFGDGHYNYRELWQKPTLKNWVPPYETVDSYHPINSYTSDDYFGLLDDNEGLWIDYGAGAYSTERLDLGIGRLPVQTPEEAQQILTKIFRYESPETYGPWRLRYTFVADDGPTGVAAQQNDLDLHVQNIDVVAEEVKQFFPAIDVQKIYAVSYPRVFMGIWRIPDARRDILRVLEEGTLVFNYSGHGSSDVLAQEEIFTKEDAAALSNRDRLAIFITATCTWGRWDMTETQSGGEVLLLNPNGGAVAVFSAVRLVYTSPDTSVLNVGLNRMLNRYLLQPEPDGQMPRLGDALRRMKNTRAGLQNNNRRFNLLGDPTLRIGFPSRRLVVESINNQPPDPEQPVPMRALERVTVQGYVQEATGQPDASFDGVVTLTVFDAERQKPLPYWRYMPTPYYLVREDLIWRGQVDVRGGRFTATFVVPKDILYSNRHGRISAYAHNFESHAAGFTEGFVVGGTAASIPDDRDGPEIRLYLNDTTFVSGGLVPPNPRLIVHLYDASGINTVGAGLGHELLLIIDGDEARAQNLSSAFRSEPNSYQRGRVEWTLTDLEPGPHTLTVRAWDVLNNVSTASLDFIISDDEQLELRNVFNYPNPTTGPTRFVFEHNQPAGTPARVQVRIYTLAGRPVRTLDGIETLPTGVLPANMVIIPWDGRDEDADPLATGIYLYRLRVEIERPDGSRQVAEHMDRLAIIR
ncbi:type IX secretion system sortase PorU [Rhodothermus profundi]|uniref:type IX secretion system sortase PorU n=1 Tax=Rhodothermus profundi TaxID=633813 RepID=UPI001FE4C613|nr:type IX secretion system sortase PorU [Rhodothermus profundi]